MVKNPVQPELPSVLMGFLYDLFKVLDRAKLRIDCLIVLYRIRAPELAFFPILSNGIDWRRVKNVCPGSFLDFLDMGKKSL